MKFSPLIGTVSTTNLPDMTSLAASGRQQNAIKYCRKVRKMGAEYDVISYFWLAHLKVKKTTENAASNSFGLSFSGAAFYLGMVGFVFIIHPPSCRSDLNAKNTDPEVIGSLSGQKCKKCPKMLKLKSNCWCCHNENSCEPETDLTTYHHAFGSRLTWAWCTIYIWRGQRWRH